MLERLFCSVFIYSDIKTVQCRGAKTVFEVLPSIIVVDGGFVATFGVENTSIEMSKCSNLVLDGLYTGSKPIVLDG